MTRHGFARAAGLATIAAVCAAAVAPATAGAAGTGGTIFLDTAAKTLTFRANFGKVNKLTLDQSSDPEDLENDDFVCNFIACLDSLGTGPSESSPHVTFTDLNADRIAIDSSARSLCTNDPDRDDVQVTCHHDRVRREDFKIQVFLGDKDDVLGSGGKREELRSLRAVAADGGEGNDTLAGTRRGDTLFGAAGADRIDGHGGRDTINGGTGDDAVRAGDGVDRISGNEGDDILQGGGDTDRMEGGIGDDRIDGEGGINVVTYENHPEAANIVLPRPGNVSTANGGRFESDRIRNMTHAVGSPFADIIDGNNQSNAVFGGSGEDSITPGENPGSKPDKIYGGAGNDRLAGALGRDRIEGNAGDDTLEPGNDRRGDTLLGGLGNDTVSYERTTRPVRVTLDSVRNDGPTTGRRDYADVENVIGGPGDDTIAGNSLPNTLSGLAGNDTVTGNPGADTLLGGNGDDRVVANDGATDSVDCGSGLADTVLRDPVDVIAGCEVLQ